MANLFDFLFPGMPKEEQPVQQPITIPLPNGGMMDDELAEFIKQNPGPAAMIGNNPNVVPSPQQLPVATQPVPSPVASLVEKVKQIAPQRVPASVSQSAPVADVISKLLEQNNSELSDAKQQRNQTQLMALLGKAGSEIGSAIAQTKPSDTSGYDTLLKMAGQPIDDIKSKHEMMSQGIKNVASQEALKNEMAKQDSNSSISKIGRDILKSAASQAGIKMDIPDNLSLANMEKILPGIENMANRKLMADSIKVKSDQLKSQQDEILKQRITQQTNTRYDRLTSPLIDRLENAKRIDKMIEKINTGEIIDSKTVSEQITGDLTQLIQGTRAALGDREEARIKTLYGLMNQIKGFAESKPTSVIPKAYVDQLAKETKILQAKYLEALQRRTKEMKVGVKNPVAEEIIQDRFDTYMGEYSKGHSPNVPSVDEVVEHNGKKYKFIGGNPADKNSWKLVK
jgi:hypothetical protein